MNGFFHCREGCPAVSGQRNEVNRQLDADYAALYPEVVPGDYALIEVSDNGTGMPPEVVARIFEPFFTTKGEGKGTGLGLAMVFGFMKQSGGHINVYSEPGVGTTFRLYLPRADAGAAGAEMASGAEEIPLGNGERVLAVEDNGALRRIIARQLMELGYHVLEAESAVAALALLEKQPVDLLFTDVIMPGELSGLQLVRFASSRWPHLRVVLTSGFPGAKLGGSVGTATTRLLSKPYRKADLARELRAALETEPAT
jgi:CheY-like chemotaxis protein